MSIDWINPAQEIPEVPIGSVQWVLIFTDKGSTRESKYDGGTLCQDDDDNDFLDDVGFDSVGGTDKLDVSSAAYSERVVAWAHLDTPDWCCKK